MYNGLEVRVPFCDYRIVEYLYGAPWEFKNYRSYEKGLLREAMKDYLPDEILWQKKIPYPKTHNSAYLAAGLINAPNIAQPWYGQLMTTPHTIPEWRQSD